MYVYRFKQRTNLTLVTAMLEAMKTLGFGDIWNSREMLRRHQTVFCGGILNNKLSGVWPRPDLETFESIFGEYHCISGEFVSAMAEDLIRAYPDAKIILTIREDEERWLQSFLSTLWYNYSTWTHWALRHVHTIWKEQAAFLDPFYKRFHGDPASHGLRVYREHNARVQRVTEPDRLLVYQVSEGWEPLCRFLGKDTPDSAFPKTNSVAEHRALFGTGRRKALADWLMGTAVQSAVPVSIAAYLWYRRADLNSLFMRR